MNPIKKRFIIDALGIGIILWVIGYALGMLLFMVVPMWIMGWIISAIMIPITIFVCYKRFKGTGLLMNYFAGVGSVWLLLGFILDYIFIVVAFGSTNYYQIDIAFAYTVTFILPIIIGYKFGKK
jgi:hypothetical protein